MKKLLLILVLATGCATEPPSPTRVSGSYSPDSGTLLVRCGRLIDGISDEARTELEIYIRNGRIEAVGESARRAARHSASRPLALHRASRSHRHAHSPRGPSGQHRGPERLLHVPARAAARGRAGERPRDPRRRIHLGAGRRDLRRLHRQGAPRRDRLGSSDRAAHAGRWLLPDAFPAVAAISSFPASTRRTFPTAFARESPAARKSFGGKRRRRSMAAPTCSRSSRRERFWRTAECRESRR